MKKEERIERRNRVLLNQRNSNVVDICSGRTSDDEAFHRLQGVVGVVVGKGKEHIHPCRMKDVFSLTVHIAACGIGGAVRAVAADRKDTAVFQTGKSRCGGQSKLLIPSAQAFAGQVDDRLTACDIGQLPAMSGMGAGDRAKETARFPGSQQSWSVRMTGS